MCLVDQVCFVYLVDLVLLVSFVQPNKRDKPNNGLPTLADFSSILLVHGSLKKRISLAPFAMPTVGIDMPCLADIDESAPPSNRTMFGMGQRSERVIRAGDHETPKSERCHRHRHKSTRRGREACTLRIGHRHEKCALRNYR